MSKAMQERPFKGENDQCVFSEIRNFLTVLNSGQGKPLETLIPADTRQVIVGAQKSVEENYSGIVESERRISQNGYIVNLHITKPEGATAGAPVFIFVHDNTQRLNLQ